MVAIAAGLPHAQLCASMATGACIIATASILHTLYEKPARSLLRSRAPALRPAPIDLEPSAP